MASWQGALRALSTAAVVTVSLYAGAPNIAVAQAPHDKPSLLHTPVPTPTVAAQDDYEGGNWHRDQCLGGLTYGAPLKLAVSWAGGLRKELANGQDVCAFVSPKVGLGGARLGAGFARTMGTFGGGIAASAGIIRTFGAPSHADRMSTYAGGSLHVFPVLALGIELGWYKRLGGVAGQGRESIITWSFGLGF